MATKRDIERAARRRKDREWSAAVRAHDGRCLVCGSTSHLQAHHCIARENAATRWDVGTGVTLCPKHHKYDRQLSAHGNPLAFALWLQQHEPERWEYIVTKIATTLPPEPRQLSF